MSCTLWFDNESGTVVRDRIEEMQQVGRETLEMARDAVETLSTLNIAHVSIRDVYAPPEQTYTPFDKPEAPHDPSIVFTGIDTSPVAPILQPVNTVSVSSPGAAPTAPILNLPTAPVTASIEDVGDAPESTPLTLPDAPDTDLPEAPTFEQLNIPTLPTIDWPGLLTAFTALRAQRPALTGNETLVSTYSADIETTYLNVTAKNAAVIAQNPAAGQAAQRVYDMLQGYYSLPATVVQMLRDRAFAAEEILAMRAIQQAREEAASMGFALPSAVLMTRLDNVRQQSRDKLSAINRDVFIEEQKVAVENLRFAVTSGIELEKLFRQQFIQLWEISEKTASRIFEIAERIFTAYVKLYELRLEAWKADVAAFEQWLKIQLSILDQYKVTIEAEKLKGEINQQRVELYKAQLQGVLSAVEIYKAQIQAISLITEQDKQRIEAFKAKVEAVVAQGTLQKVNAEVYDTTMRGELGKFNIFEAQTRAYAALVQSAGMQAEIEIKNEGLIIDWDKLQLELYQSKLNHIKTQLDAEVARISTATAIYDGKSRMYTAELGAEQARVQADQRGFELLLENTKNDALYQMERARLDISQIQEAVKILVSAQDAVARVAGQLTAGSMSAINASASIQDHTSRSNSSQCQEQYNYSIES